MDVIEAIKGRRSIRRFKPGPIEADKVKLLKDALIWAPSAGNLQKRRFYFVFNKKIRHSLADAALGQTFIAEAPLAIVGCADLTIERYYGERGTHLYAVEDVSCSIQNMMLLAHSIGLGSVWVGAFDEKMVSVTLKLPSHLRPLAIVPAGYPDETPALPQRLGRDDVVVEVR